MRKRIRIRIRIRLPIPPYPTTRVLYSSRYFRCSSSSGEVSPFGYGYLVIPRNVNGSTVSALPAVVNTLSRFEESGKITIVIRYPGGDPGRQWAQEIYDWLVSFGVPTRYLELEPGSGAADRVVLATIDRS